MASTVDTVGRTIGFLDLPFEIRKLIYDLVVLEPPLNCRDCGSVLKSRADVCLDIGDETYTPLDKRGRLFGPEFLSTCVRIRSEAGHIYYSENTFDVLVDGCSLDAIKAWLELLGERAKQMRSLKFHFHASFDDGAWNITNLDQILALLSVHCKIKAHGCVKMVDTFTRLHSLSELLQETTPDSSSRHLILQRIDSIAGTDICHCPGSEEPTLIQNDETAIQIGLGSESSCRKEYDCKSCDASLLGRHYTRYDINSRLLRSQCWATADTDPFAMAPFWDL